MLGPHLFPLSCDTMFKRRLLELRGLTVGTFKMRPWACGFKMIIGWFGLVLLLKKKKKAT